MTDKEHQEHPSVAPTPSLLHRVARRVWRRPETDPALEEIAAIEASGKFDKQWYLERNPDVVSSGMDPIQHYVRHGAAEGRDPTEAFSTEYYLNRYPDVAMSGINPFRHYLENGAAEKRQCHPVANHHQTTTGRRSADENTKLAADREIILRSNRFDARYYLSRNPDVAAYSMGSLEHFCRHGFKELRDPSANFDIVWYWLTYLPEDTATNPLVHYLQSPVRDSMEVRAAGKLSAEDKRAIAVAALRLLAPERTRPADSYVRIGIALARLKRWADAATAFSKALISSWGESRLHAWLAEVLAKQGQWERAADSWATAIKLDSSRAGWFVHLGRAQENLGRFELAAEAYQQAIEREPDRPQWHYLLGHVHEKADRRELAEAAYSEAIDRDMRQAVKDFGVGVFHQERGYWPEAADAYIRMLKSKPESAELHYRLGFAHDRCYRWQQAERCYGNAIALQSDIPHWHYRYGFVQERQEHFGEAADAYRAAATLSPALKPYWWYRCGYVLALAGRYREACLAYLQTFERQALSEAVFEPADDSATNPGASWINNYLRKFGYEGPLLTASARDPSGALAHYQLGESSERRGDWSTAADAYADAVARSNPHRPEWYYRLGFALFKAERFDEACSAFSNTQLIQRASGISTSALRKASSDLRLSTIYAEYRQTLKTSKKVILYESQTATSISCNPLAIFKRLICRNDCEYQHIWAIDSTSRIPGYLRKLPNVIFVERSSDLYLRYLATAGYLINNTGFPYYFTRKDDQRYLATWHGTPLKTLGKQQTYKFMEHKRTQRNFLQASHMISPNPHTTRILLDSYDLRYIMDGKLAETGYPRVDLTMKSADDLRKRIRSRLGVSDSKPVVLYAPTWRGTLQDISYDVDRAKADIGYLSERHDCHIVFRGHRLMEAVLQDCAVGCAVVPATVDTNELLSVVDVLVTDYSSIFFDFIPLMRPIILYAYDLKEYQAERGLYFSMDEMPGYKCLDIQSVDLALRSALGGELADSDLHERSRRRFNSHDDGNATDRVIDFFFKDDPKYVVDIKPSSQTRLLLYGGDFSPSEITKGLLRFVSRIDSDSVHLTIAISPEELELYPERVSLFGRLPKEIAIIPKVGHESLTWEERWLLRKYQLRPEEVVGERLELVRRLFGREYLRTFGRSRFDAGLVFSSGNPFWEAVFLFGRQGWHKGICIHEGVAPAGRERPSRVSGAYEAADIVISLSPATSAQVARADRAGSFPAERRLRWSCAEPPERLIQALLGNATVN